MNARSPRDSEIMSWDPENMETYWRQCRLYDSRPYDTQPVMGAATKQAAGLAALESRLSSFEQKINQYPS